MLVAQKVLVKGVLGALWNIRPPVLTICGLITNQWLKSDYSSY